jgi:hypothetical protein
VRKKELESKTVVELRALAKRMGIALGVRLKAEIIERIQKESRKRARWKPSRPARAVKTVRAVKKKSETVSRETKKARPEAAKKKTAGKTPARPVKKKVRKARPAVKKEAVLTRTGPGVPARRELMPFLRDRKAADKSSPLKKPETARPKESGLPPVRVRVLEEKEPPVFESPQHPGDRDFISAVAVEPTSVFVTWDVTDETARKGELSLRVYDVTGREYPGDNPPGVFEAALPRRDGSAEVGVSPGMEYVFEAGVIGPGGRFMPARRSTRVVTPLSGPSGGESLLPEEYFLHPYGRYGS